MAPSPPCLCYGVVRCCSVLWGLPSGQNIAGINFALQDIDLVDFCIVFWGQGFSLGQDKIRSGFLTGHGWFFALLGGTSSSVCFSVPFCLLKCCGVLPRLVKICSAFLRPALCAWFFHDLAPPSGRFFLGFRVSVGRRLAVFLSLSLLSLCIVSCFLQYTQRELFVRGSFFWFGGGGPMDWGRGTWVTARSSSIALAFEIFAELTIQNVILTLTFHVLLN